MCRPSHSAGWLTLSVVLLPHAWMFSSQMLDSYTVKVHLLVDLAD